MTKLRAIICVAIGAILATILFNASDDQHLETSPRATAQAAASASTSGPQPQIDDDSWAWNINPPKERLQIGSSLEAQRGTFKVVEISANEQQLSFNNEPIDIKSRQVGLGPAFHIGKTDLLIVQTSSGDPTCHAMFLLLISDDKGLHASNPFGDCSDLIRILPRGSNLMIRIGKTAFLAGTQGVKKIPVPKALDEELADEIENPLADMTSIFRPLLKADMKVYRWCGLLEQAIPLPNKNENRFAYIIKVGNEWRFSASSSQDVEDLRIGGQICVTGRYIDNFQYETVVGEQRSMAMLAALRVSTK